MVKTGDVVICIVCHQWHESHPEPREGDSRPLAADYTYYKDTHKGQYGVICREHDRDAISDRTAKTIDKEYSSEKFSL